MAMDQVKQKPENPVTVLVTDAQLEYLKAESKRLHLSQRELGTGMMQKAFELESPGLDHRGFNRDWQPAE